jgi:hypothetical protein
MFKHQVENVHKDLQRTKKAVIAFGDSFVDGQGAIPPEIYENYNFEYLTDKSIMRISPTEQEKQQLIKDYPNISISTDGKLDLSNIEYENAFVSQLAKFSNNKYTPINFGIRGRGNRASIKSLYFYPIDWKELTEVIVIYCPSGPERFDFASDAQSEHFLFKTIWPWYESQPKFTNERSLWKIYANMIYSEKSAIIEELINLIDISNWAKLHNAKMIIVPAFASNTYDPVNIEKVLRNNYARNFKTGEIEEVGRMQEDPVQLPLINQVDWNNLFLPEGCPTFVDMCLKLEGRPENEYGSFWDYLGKGSDNHWITKCCHPSGKAHREFAKVLYNKILEKA